ncbi:serine hydrolase [Scytonema sp. PCC 10023]|uniref:serine hydrolase n=1 Tax=Scytonema sp. PCC 10023 TaxID=1680591 RepID=UPI0039C700C6
MPKRRKYQILSNQFSKLSLASKVNHLALRFTILSVLIAILITKYMAEQFVKSSAQYSLNLPTSASPASVQVAANSPTAPLPTPAVEVAAKSPSRQNSKSLTPPPPVPDWAVAKSLPIPSRQPEKQDLEVVYNLKKPPNFKHSQELQAIVNDVVELASDQMPTKPLSITLIDAKTNETAGYQQDTPRYPASVIKMFWMVVLYAQIEKGIWKNEKDFAPYLAKMIKESDNEAASFILDEVTGTRSEPELKSEKFKLWKNKRQQVNRFFRQAGYKNISVIQKTFPIDYINLPEPDGSESQLLEDSHNWNRITTQHAARLLYEICYAGQAVSVQASKKMCGWLKRDLNPKVWRSPDSYDFNPVRTFFGESLPHTRVRLHSKAGWTSISRAEAAMVATENNKATYILAIFAQDSAYADEVDIFPKMSRLVYDRMNSRSSK